MSTRSYVGIENEDHSVDYIYIHFDGYPQGVGRELIEHGYNRDKIRDMIDNGWGRSSLDSESYTDQRGWGKYRSDSVEKYIGEDTADSWCEYFYLIRLDGNWVFYDKHFNRSREDYMGSDEESDIKFSKRMLACSDNAGLADLSRFLEIQPPE